MSYKVNFYLVPSVLQTFAHFSVFIVPSVYKPAFDATAADKNKK